MSSFITSLLMPIYLFLGLVNPVSVGSTITTINGTDTLSSSRTTINDNFTALNNGKLEQSNYFATTSLPSTILASSLTSVGTITSGTWNGTAIAVAKGGTGTTSPTSNQVMLGNGSSGLKVVSGFGTSGQFLTSNGDATAPTWQTSAIALGDDYTWTGGHMWTASSTHLATTTISASSVTGNALNLNGLNYSMPSSRGASSTVLTENGSGVLTWQFPTKKMGVATYDASTASGNLTIAHGLGIVPHRIKLSASLVNSNATGNLYESFGGYDGTTNYNISSAIKPSATIAGIGSSDSTYCVYIQVTDGTAYQRGTCAFDATNITISFTYAATLGGTINIFWEAE